MELHRTNSAYPSYSIITSVFTRSVTYTCISKSHCAFIIMVKQSKWSDESEGTTIRTINESTRRSILEDFILCLHFCDIARSRILSTIRTINESTRRSTLEDFILCLHFCDIARSRILSTQCSIDINVYLRF